MARDRDDGPVAAWCPGNTGNIASPGGKATGPRYSRREAAVAGLKKAAIAAGLETLYFSGTHRLAAAVPRRRRRDPHVPSRAAAARRALPAKPQPRDLAGLPRRSRGGAGRGRCRHRVDGRGAVGACERRSVRAASSSCTFDDGYRDNLTLRLAGAGAPPACRSSCTSPRRSPMARGELWWLTLEEAIADNDRIAVDSTASSACSIAPTPEAKTETFNDDLLVAEGACPTRRRFARWCARSPPTAASIWRPSAARVHGLGRASHARRSPARHHRRPHRRPRDAGQGVGGRCPRPDDRQRRRHRREARRAGPSISPIRSAVTPRPVRASSRSPPRSASRPRSPRGRAYSSPTTRGT